MTMPEFLKKVDIMAKTISKLSGVLTAADMFLYKKKPEDLFSKHVVKKETTKFQPTPGLAFKLR